MQKLLVICVVILVSFSVAAESIVISPLDESSNDKVNGIESCCPSSDTQTKDLKQAVDEEWLKRSISQTQRTVRWVLLGAYGELIVMPPETIPSDEMLSLVKTVDAKELAILHTDKMRLGDELIRIKSDGKIQLIDTSPDIKRALDKSLSLMNWPKHTKSKVPEVPERGLVIVPKQQKRQSKVTPPSNSIGWLFLDKHYNIYAPFDAEMQPWADCLWVTQSNDGSLLLKRRDSVFCNVTKDCVIQYVDEKAKSVTAETCYWQFVGENGLPTLPPFGMSQYFCDEKKYAIHVYDTQIVIINEDYERRTTQ